MVSWSATTSNSGVGETLLIHAPGSYMRAARVDRTVTWFSQLPAGTGWR